MRDFQELNIWQRSHQLTLTVYTITASFPQQEIYTLTSQMRRSSSSIPTNIAEGCGKSSNAEMKRYLFIAAGSCSELEYQFILSKDLNYIPENLFKELQQEIITIRKMIYAFIERMSST
ncbi:four helix bundle protein [Parafilimonas terrae]|jgi:four helix bundle protein|uniref:Four helix bundle protein n=1 Tax=Parafilimonas terrae TaxID=1465490 RepID=A0A1I5VQ59_9BACT|nr:four helix bundle protein [Parafilimonas terrae]SFQ09625.1 four helix bundle protein [Parafilimonas terrae]